MYTYSSEHLWTRKYICSRRAQPREVGQTSRSRWFGATRPAAGGTLREIRAIDGRSAVGVGRIEARRGRKGGESPRRRARARNAHFSQSTSRDVARRVPRVRLSRVRAHVNGTSTTRNVRVRPRLLDATRASETLSLAVGSPSAVTVTGAEAPERRRASACHRNRRSYQRARQHGSIVQVDSTKAHHRLPLPVRRWVKSALIYVRLRANL